MGVDLVFVGGPWDGGTIHVPVDFLPTDRHATWLERTKTPARKGHRRKVHAYIATGADEMLQRVTMRYEGIMTRGKALSLAKA